ncbi:hypothetical protein AXE80_03585 [Wenyingzhuangia fucanilytica]|uniref:Secretion system C-terminal sorting domain-containing protein n=1 Tax=Wenyingzhuangia fucanilytica TaxID=1790137 RepID=A0A1B1Y3R8_9FLAO|nr:leucine-rich repeat protein [Wenyingzhuangia fucanilytica]ANW95416.1 hypothetical protein AXE80_03585 [Wenyingzhuangia fucanilytica]
MKKTLQLLFALFTFTFASAQDFTVGDLAYTITDGTNVEVQGFSSTALTDVTVPATVDNGGTTYNVIAIGEDAFNTNESRGGDAANAGIVSVSLASSVVEVKKEAFFEQRNLTTINLGSVVIIGDNGFGVCDKMTNVDLSSLTTLGAYAFDKCHGFTGEFVAPSLVTIGNGAIYTSQNGGRDSFSSINIPSSVTTIGSLFLGKITSLRAVQVNWTNPADVTVNATNFFRDLDIDGGAITLYVPADTKALYEAAEPWGANSTTAGQYFNHANIVEGTLEDFYENPDPTVGDSFEVNNINYTVTSLDPAEVEVSGSTLAAVTIPETVTDSNSATTYTVTAVGSEAFKGDVVVDEIPVTANQTLTSVVLPSTVTLLKSGAFIRCQNLESINLENVVVLENQNVFFDCPKLTVANLSSATDFGKFSFHGFGDSTLTSIDISSAVNIYDSAFRTAQMPSVNIPASVVTLTGRVFMDCTALTEVQVNWGTAGEIPVITSDVFGNLTLGNITLYVPTGTLALYQAAAVWQDFNVVEGSLSAKDISSGSLDIQVSSDVITVNSSSTFTNANITIYDITGRVLANQVINGASASVNISNLATGIYIVKVTEGNAKLVKRFAKQ